MSFRHASLTVTCLLFLVVQYVQPLYCPVGWGQRGKLHENGIQWDRECPGIRYCFEVVTTDYKLVQKLIDFPWDPYYHTFYIRSCGGDLGTPRDFHPFRGKPEIRSNPRQIKMNITFPITITGEGGTEVFELNYICRKNYCSGLICIHIVGSSKSSLYNLAHPCA